MDMNASTCMRCLTPPLLCQTRAKIALQEKSSRTIVMTWVALVVLRDIIERYTSAE